ncbi:hypothetical protein SFR_0926 [Streptomyces sp. FR-008]|nr:hypothetical protein SFR_0926 [Streptomyces sp. FR-008]
MGTFRTGEQLRKNSSAGWSVAWSVGSAEPNVNSLLNQRVG